MRSALEWKAPSTSSLTDTACAAAATGDSRKPTYSTFSQPSPQTSSASADGHRPEKHLRPGRRPPSRTSWTSTGSPGRDLGGPPESEQTTPRSPTESALRPCGRASRSRRQSRGRRTDSYTKPGLRGLERRAKRSRLRDRRYPGPCWLVDVGGASPLHGDLSLCLSFARSHRDRGLCDALVPRTAKRCPVTRGRGWWVTTAGLTCPVLPRFGTPTGSRPSRSNRTPTSGLQSCGTALSLIFNLGARTSPRT
jgi:hypothetical protein